MSSGATSRDERSAQPIDEARRTALTRRQFMRDVSVGVLASGLAAAQASGAQPPLQKPEKMRYRRLGKTGLMVSEIAMGGHHYSMEKQAAEGTIDYQRERTRQVAAALEAGINYFDTTYDREAEALGKALTELRARDQCYIACDFWKTTEQSFKELQEAARRRFDLSLKLLHTDFVEVYRPTPRDNRNPNSKRMPGMSHDEVRAVYEVFEELRDAGKTRYFGISGHVEEYMMQAIEVLPLDLIMMPYNYMQQKAAEELFPLAKQHDVGVIVIKPFAGGSLFKAQEAIAGLEVGEGQSVTIANLKFILANPVVSTVVPGVNRVEEVLENVKAAGEKLTASEKRALAACARVVDRHIPPEYAWLRDWVV